MYTLSLWYQKEQVHYLTAASLLSNMAFTKDRFDNSEKGCGSAKILPQSLRHKAHVWIPVHFPPPCYFCFCSALLLCSYAASTSASALLCYFAATLLLGPLRLHDCSHKFFSRKHLFVGLSRAKLAAEVSLV